MLTSAVSGPWLPTRLWQRLSAAFTPHRAAGSAPDIVTQGVDTISVSRLRDLGLERDQVGGNIAFAKGDHQRFL